MKKGRIAVIFQGIGYNADKPLLYYSKKIVLERGYDVKVVEYSGIDKNCLENKNKMLEAFDLAVRQTECQTARCGRRKMRIVFGDFAAESRNDFGGRRMLAA